jgi:hypothetical protein
MRQASAYGPIVEDAAVSRAGVTPRWRRTDRFRDRLSRPVGRSARAGLAADGPRFQTEDIARRPVDQWSSLSRP